MPSPAPVATAAQLDDITAFARGAVRGALADPTTLTTSEERAQLRAFAKGYVSGALAELAATPSAGRAAVDEAVARGVFAGATQAVLGPEPVLSGESMEAYARTLAAETFDELERNGALLADLAGSPALSDITLFASDLSRGQLESIPVHVARAQLDAIAFWGAGTLDGMVVGVVTGFPQGVPAPAKEDLRRWFRAVAEGHEGTPPWSEPSSLPLLLAWADASAAAAVTAVDRARDVVTGASPPSTLDEIGAWGVGLAHGAYERLDALGRATPALERDVRAYAEGATGPGLEYLLTRPHPSLDPAAVTAYAEGMTGGADDLRGATLRALGLTETFLEDLATGVTKLPSATTPLQSATLEAYLTGVTDRLTLRLEGVAAVVSEEDPKLLAAMAEGLATGAAGIAGGPALSRPQLAHAMGNGLTAGFLETRNPRVLAEATFNYTEAAKTLVGATPPASLVAINELAQSTARDPYNAIQQYAATMGRAPVSWAENKSLGVADQAWGGLDDLLWLSAFTNASAPIILDEVRQALAEPDPQPTLDALHAYAAHVTGSLPDPDLRQAIDNLTASEYRAHARRFAQFTLTPLDWVAGKEERAAAREALQATLSNAKSLERFRDAEYSQAAIALLQATGDGLKEGRPYPRELARELKGEGFVPPWVGGAVEAIQEVPTAEVRGDISSRVLWFKTAASVVRPIAREATASQAEATREFAKETHAWVLATPERLPSATQPDLPLVSFLQASLNATFATLPAVMTDEERAAVVAYAEGVQRAVNATPALADPLQWGAPDHAAMEAYVGGIASGLGLVQEETRLYLCTRGINVSGCPPKEKACDGECPAPDPQPDPEPQPDPSPPRCEFDCEFGRYLDNLAAWSENLTAGGVSQMELPNATPTRTGIAFVARWATEVLAGHGVCPEFESPTFECDGPRGPVMEFAHARNESVAAFASAISQGYNNYIDLSDPPHGLTRPVSDPILAWAAGVQNAVGVGLLQPERFQPSDEPAPGAPVGAPPRDPSDPAFREELRAWTESVLRAPGQAYDRLWVPFPDTTGLNQTLMDLDYLWGHVIWEGGYDALDQSSANLSNIIIHATPDAALDAIALGLANATRDIMVDPLAHDLQLLLAWYQGLAHGGVEAVLTGAGTVRDEQVGTIAAYLEHVAGTYAPPAPPAGSVVKLLFPPDEEDDDEDEDNDGDDGGDGGEKPPAPPSPTSVYLTNMQSHAAGIGGAVLQAPVKPFAANATAYGALHLSYVSAIVNATTALPPVSPDAGFPARLSAWTKAQAEAASRAPPTSAERATVQPDAAMALAFVGSFAGTSPWNLPPDATSKATWAHAAVQGGIAAACPSTDAARCQTIGGILGDGFGLALPQEASSTPVPLPQEAALLQGIASGAAQGLVDATPGAASVGLVSGLVQGLVPEAAGRPEAQQVATAVATALGPALSKLPASWVEPAAREMSTALLSAEPARYQALANGSVALLLARAQGDANGVQPMQQELRAFLSPGGNGGPSVSVTDGARTYANAQLASAPALDGQRAITVTVAAPASSSARSTWELAWSATDPRAANAQRIALTGADGVLTASFAPATLEALPRAASVRFVLTESTPTGARTHPAEGAFSFTPDRDAPTATLSAPTSASGASFVVSWSGRDGDTGVASYKVEVREGDGAWREWIAATGETRASFSGLAGRSYAFRATAFDLVGHASAPSAVATTSVPAGAAANQPPSVAFVAPGEGAVFGRSVSVVLAVSDPDGTEPVVRLCYRQAEATVDMPCAYEGTKSALALDATTLADGRYRLHAIATDGTLTAEALSPVFAIDRSPPMFRGASASADPARVLLSASLDDASAVSVDVAGRTVPLVETAPGVWSGYTQLPPGTHELHFRATDATGNNASLTKTVVVPAPPPPAGSAPTTPTHSQPGQQAPPPDAPESPPKAKGTPGAPLAVVLVALAAVALAVGRRRG